MSMTKPIVIYHNHCRDGWAAVWVASLAFNGGIEPYPAMHSDVPIPDFLVKDRHVVILDFCYKRPVMERIRDLSASFMVLDHHKTSEAGMLGLEPRKSDTIVFDMNRSGAGLAWDYLMSGRRHWLVDYVEDRDLWRYRLPDSRDVNAFIGTIPFQFNEWDAIYLQEPTTSLQRAASSGWVVNRKISQYCNEILGNTRFVEFEGNYIPLVNAPQVDISEVLIALLDRPLRPSAPWPSGGFEPALPQFVMGWWCGAERYHYSLRSRGSFDVSAIARHYGGGGHLNAAGFEVPTAVHLVWPKVIMRSAR